MILERQLGSLLFHSNIHSPMPSLAQAICLLSLISLTSACFLNSCPYRRYGRTIRCASCGPNQIGICVAEGQCCLAETCIPSEECTITSVCPERFCRVRHAAGICLTTGLCCTNDVCQQSMMCMGSFSQDQ